MKLDSSATSLHAANLPNGQNMSEANTTSLLEAIATRPGMYWGQSANHFDSLKAFLTGVELANSPLAKPEVKESLADLIPHNFNEFVKEETGLSFPNTAMEWAVIIENKTHSDREALDLLLNLRKKYDQSKWAAS